MTAKEKKHYKALTGKNPKDKPVVEKIFPKNIYSKDEFYGYRKRTTCIICKNKIKKPRYLLCKDKKCKTKRNLQLQKKRDDKAVDVFYQEAEYRAYLRELGKTK